LDTGAKKHIPRTLPQPNLVQGVIENVDQTREEETEWRPLLLHDASDDRGPKLRPGGHREQLGDVLGKRSAGEEPGCIRMTGDEGYCGVERGHDSGTHRRQ